MNFEGFTNEDFHVFQIDDFEGRMDALKTKIRPKLEALGRHFSPVLSMLTGEEFFSHVAKHARRTVNPPNDTWVAFSNQKRGYKMVPHFQIGLWGTHVFIWFAMIYETRNKVESGKVFEENIEEIYEKIDNHFVWSLDHTKPEAFQHKNLSKQDLKTFFSRLQTVKSAELLCGYHIPREEAVSMKPEQFLQTAENVFRELVQLYKLV